MSQANPPSGRLPGPPSRAGMRFAVDGWDPGYGSTFEVEEDLTETEAKVQLEVELPVPDWRPLEPGRPVTLPGRVLFVDGVRRVEARAWIDDPSDDDAAAGQAPAGGTPTEATAGEATAALCASYAAGVVCCAGERAHLLTMQAKRGLFTVAPHAADIRTSAGVYTACHTSPNPAQPLFATLSRALQRRLADVELAVAGAARAGAADQDDLLVIDGPLHGRTGLPRAVGYIKSHQSAYLPRELQVMVGRLRPGERTPVFLIGNSWDRHSWYLRLPGLAGAPWAGVVRIECSPDLPAPQVLALASLTQAVLPRYASAEYKDTRAPQNLYPIAGLERELRRRLGDQRLLYRALRVAAAA